MRLNLKNRNVLLLETLLVAGVLILTGCESAADIKEREFEKNAPPKQENMRVLVDAIVTSEGEKTEFVAKFYHDISKILDGQEVRGVGKDVLNVNSPKLAELELTEAKDGKKDTIYSAKIPSEPKEFELTFSPNENLESKHKLSINPITIEAKSIKLTKSNKNQIQLSRKLSDDEQASLAFEIADGKEKLIKVSSDKNSDKLDFYGESLLDLKNGNTNLVITIKSDRSQREKNKSVSELSYIIRKSVQIAD